MKRARALVEPDILRWARVSAGLAIEDAAKALQTKADNVIAWEQGDEHPWMPQLRNSDTTQAKQLFAIGQLRADR
jgi:DNA-binding transcriptional regulator YiaG